MTEPNSSNEVLLDASADPNPELGDHPESLSEDDHALGLTAWQGGQSAPALFAASPGYAEAMRRAKIVRDCLLAAGVPEVKIDLLPGRPTTGGVDRMNACSPVAAMSHHIASRPTPSNPVPGLNLVRNGRADLGGPLANGTAGVDLVYRIITLGMANHPGTGGPWTVKGPLGSYTIPKDVARPYVWGTEWEGGYDEAVWDATYTNKATGVSMTFREFMGRANAGLTRAVWLINGRGKDPGKPGELDLSGYHGEHKTWAPGRKPDRLGYTTEAGRTEIRKYNTAGEDDDVSAKDVWEHPIKVYETGKKVPARVMLAQTHHRAQTARKNSIAAAKNSAAALRQAEANRAAIKELAATLSGPDTKRVLAALGADVDLTAAPVDESDLPEETEEA